MKKYVYADNAATTKLDSDAFEAMKPFLLEEYGNASQPYSFSRSAKEALKEAREIIASCINADPDEIYFTSGGTESDNWAIKGFAFSRKTAKIVTSAIEHHAILNSCKAIEKLGCSVEYLPVTGEGIVEPSSLDAVIPESATLVSIMFANNEIGTIEPIKALAEVAHAKEALFHTDAVQAVGHVNIDVKELGVDMLSASAHKFNGPKGIGFLYIKRGTNVNSLNDGGAQEFGMRAGTENIASIIGMAVALKKNCDQIEGNAKYISDIEKRLLSGISKLDYIRNGASDHIPGNISLSFAGADGEAILHRMDFKGICISTGSACDSVNTQVSHVIKAIGVENKYAKGTIRISLCKDNTFEDVDEIASAIASIIKA